MERSVFIFLAEKTKENPLPSQIRSWATLNLSFFYQNCSYILVFALFSYFKNLITFSLETLKIKI